MLTAYQHPNLASLKCQHYLEEIAEALHAKGYSYRTGRPFIELTRRGKRKANISTLSNIFHNWTYAGWVVSEHNGIAPKTVQGKWKPLVSTEEFEQGLDILARRNAHRTVRRREDYLLKGMIFYQENGTCEPIRLTCSTSNARRSGGGTAYYRISGKGGVSFLCSKIDPQIGRELKRIQVDPELLPLLRASYTQALTDKLGFNTPDEQMRLQNALKAVDEEEVADGTAAGVGENQRGGLGWLMGGVARSACQVTQCSRSLHTRA